MEKLIKVFFGSDLLPYKDKERTVHFPITGNAFLGASNTTKIRFYFDYIGNENITWVSVAKLPNGKQGSKVLSVASDEDGNYAELQLSNWYTQAKGDVFIALQGYQGGVDYTYDSESELYEIHGTPTIQTTGSIKLAINYAPIGQVADYNDEFSTYQQILALLGSKADISSVAIYIGSIEDETYPTYQALFDYVGLRPFIAFYEGELCMFHFVEHDTEPTTYSLRQVSPYGIFETDTLTMTDSVLPTYTHCLLDTINCVELSGTAGQLSDIEVERLSQENASIKLSGRYYNKHQQISGGDTIFSNVEAYTSWQGAFKIDNRRIVVNLSEKSWNISNISHDTFDRDFLEYKFLLKADKSYVDTEFAKKSGNNTFTGTNTFENHLPQSELLATNGNDLINLTKAQALKQEGKDYTDQRIAELQAKSDVIDVLGNLTELRNYDTAPLGENDIMNVLSDSEHDNASTFYKLRIAESGETYIEPSEPDPRGFVWVFVGEEGPFLTPNEADNKYQTKIISLPLLNIPTSAWTQDSETGKWRYVASVSAEQLTIGTYDKYYLGGNDRESSDELAEQNINIEDIVTTNDTTTITLVGKFQPTIVLNVSVVVAKVSPSGNSGITFVSIQDLGSEFRIVNNKVKLKTSLTFNDLSLNELRVDNGQYQLYVESPSNDMAGFTYVSANTNANMRIYQGVPEITNESDNYKLEFRVGQQEIYIELKDKVNDTTETFDLLALLRYVKSQMNGGN